VVESRDMKPENVRDAGGKVAYARYAKPLEERKAAVGKMCEPRLKSQRVKGRAREAGCEEMRGTSKRERVAMPPEARKAVDMLRIWRAFVDVEDAILEEEREMWSN
jgi:hypothetical protein